MIYRNVLRSLSLIIAAVVLAGCSGFADRPAAASDPSNSLTVVGVGQAFGQPDQATLRLGHVVKDRSVTQAIDESNEVLRQVREAIQQQGVADEDIQTINFSIFTEESRDPATSLSGAERTYRVENTLLVTVRQIDQVGKVIEAALEHGANNVHGLQFGLSDQSPLADQARSAAVADARQRAQQLAAELDLSLGRVLEVREQSSGGVSPVMEAAFGIGGGAPPISEGSLSVDSRVEISFALDGGG